MAQLSVFVEEDRRALDRNTVSEWFQWLAERMIEREKSTPAVPAHIAHREWQRAVAAICGRRKNSDWDLIIATAV